MSNEICEYDFKDSLKNVLNKRFDRESRAYKNLSEQYDNFEDLPELERNTLLRTEANKILQENELKDLKQKSLLRTIKTLRTSEEIKDAVNAGHKVLKQKVEPSKHIRITDLHIKDRLTGKTNIVPYSYHNLPSNYFRYKVKNVTYYPYDFPSKTAAYLLPDDLVVAERVVLEDLIEDIVGESHAWGTYRLDSAEAVWNGKKFEVDCRSYDVKISMG